MSDVLATPALIAVIRSIEECKRLRVYCKCEFTFFIDCIVRDGSEEENNEFFWACHEMFIDMNTCIMYNSLYKVFWYH